ncbi:MAG: hypothetical protein V9H69_16615 [Anaerolineae bacterium]
MIACTTPPGSGRPTRPLLIALQATCLVGSLGLVVAVVSGDAPGFRFTSWLIFLAALAGVYSAQWLAGPAQRLVGKTGFQLAQLLLLLAVLRVLTWALAGDWPTLADLRGWILHPWTFFDGIFVALAILCALAWHRASVVGGIFYRLALTPGELAVDSERRMSSWRMGRHSERVLVSRADLVEDYVVQWMVGGVFLALFAAATRVRIGPQLSLNVLDMGVPAPMVAALAFYFLIGLALLSQARLAVLRAQWLVDGVEMPEQSAGPLEPLEPAGHRRDRPAGRAAAAGLLLAARRHRQRAAHGADADRPLLHLPGGDALRPDPVAVGPAAGDAGDTPAVDAGRAGRAHDALGADAALAGRHQLLAHRGPGAADRAACPAGQGRAGGDPAQAAPAAGQPVGPDRRAGRRRAGPGEKHPGESAGPAQPASRRPGAPAVALRAPGRPAAARAGALLLPQRPASGRLTRASFAGRRKPLTKFVQDLQAELARDGAGHRGADRGLCHSALRRRRHQPGRSPGRSSRFGTGSSVRCAAGARAKKELTDELH